MFYRSKIYVTISARSFTIVPFFILNGSHLKLVKSSSLVITYKEVANVCLDAENIETFLLRILH